MSQDVRPTRAARGTEWQAYEATDAELREQVNRRIGKAGPRPEPWTTTWRWFDVAWLDDPVEPAGSASYGTPCGVSVYLDGMWQTAVAAGAGAKVGHWATHRPCEDATGGLQVLTPAMAKAPLPPHPSPQPLDEPLSVD
jgi:hypothetical protein